MRPRTILLSLLLILLPYVSQCQTASGGHDSESSIENTYWRDLATGDWLIGFAQDHVVLESKVWDITGRRVGKDTYKLALSYDGGALRKEIKVGRLKDGTRLITIGKDKPIECGQIVTESLPGYPTKDESEFTDNGYRLGDSVEISGWIKDRSQRNRARMHTFKVTCANIFTAESYTYQAPIDSIGRFHLKMPLLNTSEAHFEWGPWYTNTFIEPGKSYFFLQDFRSEPQRRMTLFMGADVRGQNENEYINFAKYHFDYANRTRCPSALDFMHRSDSTYRNAIDSLNLCIFSNPNVSKRCRDFVLSFPRAMEGFYMGQARFVYDSLPKPYTDYLEENVWQKALRPYTLSRSFNYFMTDWYEIIRPKRKGLRSTDLAVETMLKLERDGKITISDYDHRLMDILDEKMKAKENAILRLRIEREAGLPDVFKADSALREAMDSVTPIFNNVDEKMFEEAHDRVELSKLQSFVNAETADSSMHDILITRYLIRKMRRDGSPLDSLMLAFAESELRLPTARYFLEQTREVSQSLQSVDSTDIANIRQVELPDTMTDGKTLFDFIVRPYRGRPVVICLVPTEVGINHVFFNNKSDYARLKPYNAMYLLICRPYTRMQKEAAWSQRLMGDDFAFRELTEKQWWNLLKFLQPVSSYNNILVAPDGKLTPYELHMSDLGFIEGLLSTF